MQQIIKTYVAAVSQWFEATFFAPMGTNGLRLFRGAVGLATLLTALSWLGSFKWFFGPEGYVPLSAVGTLGKFSASWMHIFSYSSLTSLPVVTAAYILLMVAAICLILGKYVKVAAPVAFVLLLSFLGRNAAMSYGGTDVLQLLLLAVVLLSLPGRRAPERWPVFLMQFQFALIYFVAGVSKLQTPAWVQGTKMFSTLSDPTFSYINPGLLLAIPVAITAITWFGFMSELAFSFLIWSKATRRVALVLAVMLHVGVIFTMNVHLFSEIMLLGLTIFLTEPEAKWVLERLHTAKSRVVSAVRGSKR
ncbi:hypothetical protein BH11PAT4_BH11PAT4_3950 [soil metagenome]